MSKGDGSSQHQYLLMCNVEKHKLIKCESTLQHRITKFLFINSNRLLCQTPKLLVECVLKNQEGCFVLKPLNDAIKLELGTSRLDAFEFVEDNGEGLILLTRDKVMNNQHEKQIYSISVPKVRQS